VARGTASSDSVRSAGPCWTHRSCLLAGPASWLPAWPRGTGLGDACAVSVTRCGNSHRIAVRPRRPASGVRCGSGAGTGRKAGGTGRRFPAAVGRCRRCGLRCSVRPVGWQERCRQRCRRPCRVPPVAVDWPAARVGGHSATRSGTTTDNQSALFRGRSAVWCGSVRAATGGVSRSRTTLTGWTRAKIRSRASSGSGTRTPGPLRVRGRRGPGGMHADRHRGRPHGTAKRGWSGAEPDPVCWTPR